MSYRDKNRAVWDRMARRGSRFARTATEQECRNPLATLDSRGWLPPTVVGLDVLCLASGGGWQSILYATAGACVTVVDISPEMLELDEQQARQRGLSIRIIESSMDDLTVLRDESFDIVHQPVSTCYVPCIENVYRGVSRVLRDSGLYISQHKQPTSLQVTHRNEQNQLVIGVEYYNQGPLPECEDTSYRETGSTEYLHRWEKLVGSLCRHDFVVEDLREPLRANQRAPVNHYGYRGRFVAPFVRIKARRRVRAVSHASTAIWTP